VTTDDPLLAALASLDPAAAAVPPARGSTRDDQILERAMHPKQQTSPPPIDDPDAGTDGHDGWDPVVPLSLDRPERGRRRYRWVGLAGAAAVLAVVALVVATRPEPDPPPTPLAALGAAADATGEVTTLRVRATYWTGDEAPTRMEGEIDGSSYVSRFYGAGAEEPSNVRTVIGDQRWESDGDEPSPQTIDPAEANAPYPEASRAVVRAALTGATVRDLGPEDVAGVEAAHYAIELGERGIAALAALTPQELARFELEYPQGVTGLDVWVAEGLIRRIDVRMEFDAGDDLRSVIEFYDFGADITIEPPG